MRFASEQNSFLLTAKANKVGKFIRIIRVQPSIFCRNNFSRRISPSKGPFTWAIFAAILGAIFSFWRM